MDKCTAWRAEVGRKLNNIVLEIQLCVGPDTAYAFPLHLVWIHTKIENNLITKIVLKMGAYTKKGTLS